MDGIYKRIRLRREELGYSQDILAQKLGYKSRSSINKIESGTNDIPQSKIEEIAKALNTTPAIIMDRRIRALRITWRGYTWGIFLLK